MVKKVSSINLVSSLKEGDNPKSRWFTFNMTVAWFLRKAFEKKGVQCNFVNDRTLLLEEEADHTIVTSGMAMKFAREMPHYLKVLRKTTNGKLTVYLDADYKEWEKYFDIIFTVVELLPITSRTYYRYVGWGADPKYCYPDQDERAVFLDSLMHGYYDNKFNKIYDIYKKTLSALDLKVYNPWPRYHGSVRLLWYQVQELLRKSHYYCCTQLGESGLTRIEAATCGALLVVPRPLYRPRTMASLEHRIWDTEDDLIKILKTKTDPQAIRKKALAHSWDKVASRILKTLYEE